MVNAAEAWFFSIDTKVEKEQPKYWCSLIELLSLNQLVVRFLVMPVDQFRLEQPFQLLDHLVRPNPRVVVSRQPTMRMRQVVVLRNVVLISSPDIRPVFLQIHLHDAKAWGVAGRVVDGDTLAEVEVVVGEGVPFQFREVHVGGEVDAEVGASAYGPAGMLEFFFMDVDGGVGTHEVFEASSVVEMEMANDDGFDILDVVTRGLDGRWELHFFRVLDTGKDICKWSAPSYFEILRTTCLEQDQTHIRVLDQGGQHHQIATLALWVLVAQRAGTATSQEPSFVGLQGAKIEDMHLRA